MVFVADGSLDCSAESPPLTCDAANGYCFDNGGTLECRCNEGFTINGDNTCSGRLAINNYDDIVH